MDSATVNKYSIPSRALMLAALLCLPATGLAYEGEILLFPTVAGLHRNSPIADHPQDEIEPSLDAFYSASHGRLRFLAEFFMTPDEKEMERMQIGWLPTPSTTMWLGRFHNPLGYWNTEFHHGNYLATTITRPGIIAFEEHGRGVLPTHISGLLLEETADTPINYSVALGVGPTLGITGLMPIDILQPTKRHGRLAASAKLTYRPVAGSLDEAGIFAAHTSIPAENPSMSMGITKVTQTLVGADLNREFGNLRLMGELYIVNNRIEPRHVAQSNTFTSGYVQAEYSIQPGWTLFGRVEDTADANGDPYLNLRPDFIKSRTLAGARYELSHNQALKLELSHSKHQDKTQFNQLAMEWSAVFP